MPGTRSVGLTNDSGANGLMSGTAWNTNYLTYSFPLTGAMYEPRYGSNEPLLGYQALNGTQQAAVVRILSGYASVSNLSFGNTTELPTAHADIRLAESSVPDTAYAYGPSSLPEGGDVWLNSSDYNSPVKGNYAYMTLIHEHGHSLGLKHSHETEGAFPAASSSHDTMEYTVMSYRSTPGAAFGYTNETYGFAQSLMMDDIAAIQEMYGADYSTNAGTTKYTWSPTTGEMFINGAGQGRPGGNQVFLTIWDGGGTDTYDMSNYSSGVAVNLNPGAWSTTSHDQLAKLNFSGKLAVGTVANARLHDGDTHSLIENASGGSGNDTLIGNTVGNVLKGNSGNDVLKGGAGGDALIGGKGADRMYAGSDDSRDTFEYTSDNQSGTKGSTWDRVYDFDRKSSSGERVWDRIDLSDLDLKWGDIHLDTKGSSVKVLIDSHGSSSADMIIEVMHISTLVNPDFLL